MALSTKNVFSQIACHGVQLSDRSGRGCCEGATSRARCRFTPLSDSARRGKPLKAELGKQTLKTPSALYFTERDWLQLKSGGVLRTFGLLVEMIENEKQMAPARVDP